MKQSQNILQQSLNKFKDEVIGIVKHDNQIEFLIDYELRKNTKPYIKTLIITKFLAIHTFQGELLPSHTIHLFPEYKTLAQMINNPFEWNEFCKNNNIK